MQERISRGLRNVRDSEWRTLSIGILLFWALLAWVAFHTSRELTEDIGRVAQSHDIVHTIGALRSHVTDVETARRGYVITGDAAYLEPLAHARDEIGRLQGELVALTREDAEHQAHAEALTALIPQHVVSGDRGMIDREGRSTGKELHDRIRARLDLMEQAETQRLIEREQRAQAGRDGADLSLALALGLLGLGLTVTMLLARSRIVAERRLGQTEARYRELFEASPVPIWVIDRDSGRFLVVNEAAAVHYGYSRAEFADMAIEDVVSPDQREAFALTLEKAGKADRRARGVWHHRLKDGRPIEVELSARPIEFDGRAAHLMLVSDITARERYLADLRESEARFQTVFDLQFQFMAILSPAGRISLANDLFVDATGLDRDAVSGADIRTLSIWDVDGPDGVIGRAIDRVVASGQPFRIDLRFRRPDASEGWLEASLRPVNGAGGSLSYLIFQAHDLTERVRNERALELSERRLLAAQERTGMACWDVDLASGALWWSANMDRLVDRDGASLPASIDAMPDLAIPEDRDSVRAFLAEVAYSIGSAAIRFRHRSPGGGECHFELAAECVYSREGVPLQIVGSLLDITDRLSMERRLHQAQRLEAVGKLTGGVAHDFNNLLTIVIGNSEALADALDDAELRELAELSFRAANRGAELTSQLLAFARRQPLKPSVVAPSRLVQDIHGLLRKTVSQDVDLEIVCGAGAWRTHVDRAQLESAILNLAINARDAMPRGGKLTIEVANAHLDQTYANAHGDTVPGQYVMIAVSDTGTGMTPDIVDRAFEPFFSTKGQYNNSGLGLSMVHGFVKQSGGHVKIYSEPGIGTTVKLYLRRSAAEEVPDHAQLPSRQHIPRGTERILVVEDDDLVRKHVARQLTELGYSVATAADGARALALLENDARFDLLFTDVVMPGGVNGRQLALRARALIPGIPVLFTSGYTENAIVHHGRLDQGVQLLSKPYRLRTLALKVRAALDDLRAAGDIS